MELANFTANVIRITEQNNPEELKLSAVYNPLKDAELSIFGLQPTENGSRRTTAPYTANRKERKDCVIALKNVAKGILDINAEDKRPYIQLLYPAIKAGFTDYYRKNIVEQNEIVRQFLHQIDTNTALTEAVNMLGMQSEIASLRAIHGSITSKYETMRKVKASYVKKNSKEIRNELIVLIEDFFTNLYLAKKQHTDVDYSALENELNAEIQRVRLILLERKPEKKKTEDSTEKESA